MCLGFSSTSSVSALCDFLERDDEVSASEMMRNEYLKLQCFAGMQFTAIISIFQYSVEKDGERRDQTELWGCWRIRTLCGLNETTAIFVFWRILKGKEGASHLMATLTINNSTVITRSASVL